MSNKGRFKEFVYLDFRNKIVYFANQKRDPIWWSVPATQAEYNAFITHFHSKGITECTFKQLKQYVNFHGTRKQGRIYAEIPITDEFVYMKLIRQNADFQGAISDFIDKAHEKIDNSIINRKVKIAFKHSLKAFFRTYEDEMDKMIDD